MGLATGSVDACCEHKCIYHGNHKCNAYRSRECTSLLKTWGAAVQKFLSYQRRVRIFLSYRRGDAGGYAGRLADDLGKHGFRVFQDVTAIGPGEDYDVTIDRALKDSGAVLAVIGGGWLDASTSQGSRRLLEANDYVRLELATALQRKILVIPVLVGGADLPTAADLPEELQALTQRQGVELRDDTWHQNVEGLAKRLRGKQNVAGRRSRRRPILFLTAAAAVAGLLAALYFLITALYFPSGTRVVWPYDTGSAVYSQPTIVNSSVYLGSTNGYVYALNADTGAVRWQFPQAGKPAIGSVYSSPVVAGNMVYVGSDDGRIYALKDTTGVPAWSRPCHTPGDRVRSSPLFVDGVVYATSGNGYVCAMRAASGNRYWNPVWIGLGAPGSSPTAAAPRPGTGLHGISIYVGSGDGHVYALNAGSGAIRWQFPPKGQPGVGIIDSQPTMSADRSAVYAASSGEGGHLYALAADTGKIQWEYPPKNQPGIGTVDSQPAVASDGSAVYIASGFDVYALTPSSGTPLSTWKSDPVHLQSTIDTAGPELGTVAIYVGSGEHVDCLNATTGARCWLPPFTADSRVVSTPAVNGNNGTIYFGTLDGKVYALTPTGAVVCAPNARSCSS